MDKFDKFWLEDASVLFSVKGGRKRFLEFYPRAGMNNIDILNSITRFSLYLALLFLMFIDWNSYYFFIPIILIILCLVVYKIEISDVRSISNQVVKPTCTKPSKTNPMMNVLLYDYIDAEHSDKPAACLHDDPETKKEVNKNFYDNLFVNVDDIYENRNSQRQFYTMPVSTIPNDQDSFAKWCYKMPEEDGCKTNQESCLRYEDVRYKRFNNFPTL